MIQKIKDALNNSYLWLLFLLGCIAYFWRKEDDLENELAEEKSAGKVKDDEEKQSEVDHTAANVDDEYRALRDAFLRASDKSLRRELGGEAESDSSTRHDDK